MYRTIEGLFKIFIERFRPQHKETIFFLLHCELGGQCKEKTEKQMGRLRIKGLECKYKENDMHFEKAVYLMELMVIL